MGSSPDMVNYKGEVLTAEMRNYLYGSPLGSPDARYGNSSESANKARADEILANWMTGIRPKTIDPAEKFGMASSLSPLKDRAAAGMGIGGLFGFGKSLGGMEPLKPLGQSPMAAGVPYTVPPLPKLGGLKGKG